MLGEERARIDGANDRADTSSRGGASDHAAAELSIGEAVGGTDWILEGTLGRGGMAVVLAVVKRLGGIRGAMKVPHAELVARKEVGARFLEEAQLYTSLKHPHIVGVIDCGLLQGGTPFMVMERLRGRTLRQVMSAADDGRRTLKPSTAYEVASCVCDALQRLHSHRPVAVVHRDVKPENIFIHEVEGVAGRGTVKLLDLGLAGQVGVRRKVTMGTPRYMAPEQILGDGVSEHTDQYAVALVLYEMLSGRLPWNADVTDAEAMAQVHLKKPPLPLSQFCPWVPESVRKTIERALAKDPEMRLPSILHFLDGIRDLDSVRHGLDEVDVCTTATTAPTLASLAAYDTSPGEAPVGPQPSWAVDPERFDDRALLPEPGALSVDGAPRVTSSQGEPDGNAQVVAESPGRTPQASAAPPAAVAKKGWPLVRGAAPGSLGLGFCLGAGAALVAVGIRSHGAPKPQIEPPPLVVATDQPAPRDTIPAELLTKPPHVPALSPSEESAPRRVAQPIASAALAPAAAAGHEIGASRRTRSANCPEERQDRTRSERRRPGILREELMAERSVESDRDALAPEVQLHKEPETDVRNAPPTMTTDDPYDATWTDRMLNSLVAWGRRERGLVRRAHSDARSYVAYSARARPIPASAKGTVDRGTVELEAREDHDAAERAQQVLRAQYAATTVVIRRPRFSWWWVALAVCVTGGLCVIGTHRDSKGTTIARGTGGTAPAPPRTETPQPRAPSPTPRETVAGPASPAATASPESHSFVASPQRPLRAEPRPQARAHAAPSASSSSRAEAHKEFVDVVTEY